MKKPRTLSLTQLQKIESINFEEFKRFYIEKYSSLGEEFYLSARIKFKDSIANFLIDLNDETYLKFKETFFSKEGKLI